MDSLEKIRKNINNLPQYKDKTSEEKDIISKEIFEKQEILNSLTFCLDEEKDFASNLLEKYLAESSMESFSDKDTLRQLIDLEIILERIKTLLNTEYKKANAAIPLQMLEQLTSLNNQVMDLKESLGLSQKKDEKKDTVKVIDNMLERFHKWINKPENRSNYEFQCPKCAEIFILRQRLDKISDEVREHPWFIEGGILFNKEIFKDLDLGKISEDQVVRYLNVTLDYVKWIKQNYPLNKDQQQETKDEE